MKLNILLYLVCACAGLEFLFNTRGIQEGRVLYYFTSLSREVKEPIETCEMIFSSGIELQTSGRIFASIDEQTLHNWADFHRVA